jgi:hypothetical protein
MHAKAAQISQIRLSHRAIHPHWIGIHNERRGLAMSQKFVRRRHALNSCCGHVAECCGHVASFWKALTM